MFFAIFLVILAQAYMPLLPLLAESWKPNRLFKLALAVSSLIKYGKKLLSRSVRSFLSFLQVSVDAPQLQTFDHTLRG